MRRKPFLWQIALLFFITLFSCTKDDVRNSKAQLIVVNASPNSGSIELLQNLQSVGQFTYGTALSSTVNYIPVDSGFNNYKLKKGVLK